MTRAILKGKVALIVGASSGIGASAATALAEAGCAVLLAARRQARLDALATKIGAAGGDARIATVDVTTPSDAQKLVEVALGAWGRIDILVYAAGVGVAAQFQNTLPAESRAMVEVNLMGFLHCLEAVVPRLRAQLSGHVVVISSGAGRYFHPSVVYSGTKHAVSAIAESLRREVGREGVRVTCIDPGAVKTEFLSNMRPDVIDSVNARLGDMVQLESEDVANAVLYALTQPKHVNVNILTIYPTEQA